MYVFRSCVDVKSPKTLLLFNMLSSDYSASVIGDTMITPDNFRIKFTGIYNAYAPAMFGVICRTVRDRHTAEELLQNVFTKIWLHFELYDSKRSRLFTWMLAICRNEIIDYLRSPVYSRWKQTTLSDDQLPEKMVHPFWERSDLMLLMSRLSTTEKVMVDLIYWNGFTFGETAAMLSMPEGTVKTRMRMLLKRLKSKPSRALRA